MHHSHSRKKKEQTLSYYRMRDYSSRTKKKPNAQAAVDKKIKLKRRTLYLLSYGGSDVVEKRRRLGILNNTAIGDRTQDHSLNFVNPPFRKFKTKNKTQKKYTKKEGKILLCGVTPNTTIHHHHHHHHHRSVEKINTPRGVQTIIVF